MEEDRAGIGLPKGPLVVHGLQGLARDLDPDRAVGEVVQGHKLHGCHHPGVDQTHRRPRDEPSAMKGLNHFLAHPEELEVFRGEGEFPGGAEELAQNDGFVLGVDEGVLVGPGEEFLRVAQEILVQRVALAHDEHEGGLCPAAGPAGLLPDGDDRARIAPDYHSIQAADIHPELQGTRGHHPADLALPNPPLDGPPLFREVPGPVGHDLLPGNLGLGVGGEDFGEPTGGGKTQGLEALRDEKGHEGGDLLCPGHPQIQKRVPKDEGFFAPWGAVLVHHGHAFADELFPVLRGVGDGGRSQDELGLGPVAGSDPL